jgi:hypothetical protein
MADAVAGLVEMRRGARPGGLLAATMWDHDRGPLSPLWRAVERLGLPERETGPLLGSRAGELADLFERVGLSDVRSETLTLSETVESFEEWWEPMTLGVGPVGEYVQRLDDPDRAALREECTRVLPEAPFDLSVTAWCTTGRA